VKEVASKRRLTFSGLYGATSQKIELEDVSAAVDNYGFRLENYLPVRKSRVHFLYVHYIDVELELLINFNVSFSNL
jgi:hypothetical protein